MKLRKLFMSVDPIPFVIILLCLGFWPMAIYLYPPLGRILAGLFAVVLAVTFTYELIRKRDEPPTQAMKDALLLGYHTRAAVRQLPENDRRNVFILVPRRNKVQR